MNRREFIINSSALATCFVLGVNLQAKEANVLSYSDLQRYKEVERFDPNVFISIDSKGTVTIICHRSEMGQGIRGTLPLLVADEMEADWSRVVVEQGLANTEYGSQNTDGSRSVRRHYDRLRQFAATARTLLQQAGAQYWSVPLHECEVKQHQIIHIPSQKKVDFAEVVSIARTLPLPDLTHIQLKSEQDFRYIGQPKMALYDGEDIVTGRAIYGYDVSLPNLHIAVIERPPVLFGRVKSFDSSAALAVKGVIRVLELPALKPPAGYQMLGGVAVIAEHTWAALEGRKRLKIEWDLGHNQTYDTQAHEQAFAQSLDNPPHVIREAGSWSEAKKEAEQTIEAEYYFAGLAHATLEPPAATAIKTSNGGIECWSCTQRPQKTQELIADSLKLEKDQVIVHVTLLGGGFGRKSKPDFVQEAAYLATITNLPIKVLWTREDEIKFGFYHSPSLQRLSATVHTNKVSGWYHSMVNHPIGATFDVNAKQAGSPALGQADIPFALDNLLITNGETETHFRIGWIRSVTNVNNAFAVGCFVDEIAQQLQQDPKQLWLTLIGADRQIDFKALDGYDYGNYGESLTDHPVDTSRLKGVLTRVTTEAQWDKPLPKGHGVGLSVHRSYAAYVACVVEVSVNAEQKIKLERVEFAVDCGRILNPDRVRSQMEGAAIFGASLALYGEITAKNGAVIQGNFDDYPLLRMNQSPIINVHLMENNYKPGGVGEPGIPPFAPALYNAIYQATGKRYRRTPLSQYGII